jgi:hypothetical protein
MENVIKTFEQLKELYNNHYQHEDYDNSWDAHAVDYCYYELDMLEGWIIEHRASGDSVCGCDYCYQEFHQVVKWVEGHEPSDCQE